MDQSSSVDAYPPLRDAARGSASRLTALRLLGRR